MARRLDGLGAEVVLVDNMIPEFGGRPGARQRPLNPRRRGSSLRAAAIGTAVHYPVPVQLQPAYRRIARGLARSEHAAREILGLPIYPQLEDAAVDQVISAIKRFF